MKRILVALLGAVALVATASAQGKPTLVINPFMTASDVKLPYDLKQLQTQAVAELSTMLKDWDVVADAPPKDATTIYWLDVKIVAWRSGNAAKRVLIGLGSGREAADIQYWLKESKTYKPYWEQQDTIRTNFASQSTSTGTLAHPFALKIADRIKEWMKKQKTAPLTTAS